MIPAKRTYLLLLFGIAIAPIAIIWGIPSSIAGTLLFDGIVLALMLMTLQSTGALRKLRQIAIGTEFAELRDYGTGDDSRLIGKLPPIAIVR